MVNNSRYLEHVDVYVKNLAKRNSYSTISKEKEKEIKIKINCYNNRENFVHQLIY